MADSTGKRADDSQQTPFISNRALIDDVEWATACSGLVVVGFVLLGAAGQALLQMVQLRGACSG